MKRERIYLTLGYFCKLAIFGSKIKVNVFLYVMRFKAHVRVVFNFCYFSIGNWILKFLFLQI